MKENKICKKCGLEKNLNEFHKDRTTKDGYYPSCKECKRNYQSKYRKSENGLKVRRAYENSESGKKSVKKYRSSDRYKKICKNFRDSEEQVLKNRCRKITARSIKNNILIKPKKCQICNAIDCLEAHHEDYSKPLEVIFCCKSCHMGIHYHQLDKDRKKVYNNIINKMKGKER